jgi:hypothetical protein
MVLYSVIMGLYHYIYIYIYQYIIWVYIFNGSSNYIIGFVMVYIEYN